MRKVTSVPRRNQSRILASKQPQTLHNVPDSRPDLRERKRALTRSDTATISDYLDNDSVSLNNKGKPWLDVTETAGVSLPNTSHFKLPRLRLVTTQTIRRAYERDKDLINATYERKKELTER